MVACGTAWYPEHWPEKRWSRDLQLIRDAGFTVIRVGEFAWSTLEASDGAFDFAWLRRALDLAHSYQLQVILCTPTAAPPAWLTQAHPDILAIKDFTSGAIQPHGERCHYDPTNQTYITYCERIIRKIAEEFHDHPSIIGWQTDNEFGPEFGSIAQNPGALQHFRQWCLKRFGGLDGINEAWSTAFWSQTYSDSEQIVPPLPYPNPGLYLAWYRWASDAIAAFQAVQLKTLRSIIPESQWICHNFHPFDDLDRTPIAKDLDLIGWDAYIYQEDGYLLDPALSGRDADRCRDLNQQQRPFWILETVPGFVNWRGVNRHAAPGETRSMAWHLVGHGADAVMYWQFRSAPCNQEQYHGCLLQQDGEPRPVYYETAAFAKEFQQHAALLEDTQPVCDVALIDRWCDRMILRNQPHHERYDAKTMPLRWYRPMQQQGFGMRVLEELSNVPEQALLIAPQLNSLDQRTAQTLIEYVEGGGHLLLGPRFGMKNQDNALLPQRQPGPLAPLLAADVREYYSLANDVSVTGEVSGSIDTFGELWQLHDEKAFTVLARFGDGDGWLRDQPAVFTRPIGNGRITVCAGCPSPELAQAITTWACQASNLQAPFTPPENVEMCRRKGAHGTVTILINHGDKSASVQLDQPRLDILSDTEHQERCELEAYGVAVFHDK